MDTRILNIEGMSCGHCVARVSKALSALPGVRVEDVSVGTARIGLDESQTTLDRIGVVLDEAGYALRQESPRR